MTHLYLFNPARKIRLLSALLYRGSQRILGTLDSTSRVLGTKPLPKPSKYVNLPVHPQPPVDRGQLVRDTDFFYPEEIDCGFCVFRVENTLFKVHRVLLTREPSAFCDMFCLPQPKNESPGTESSPVALTDTVDQFKDFLWAVYAPPTDLFSESRLDRLLNVLELANKYCFSSLESWTVDRIYILANKTNDLLRSASSALLTRILHLAVLSNHRKLQDLVTQNLICRILWYNTRPETILPIAEMHGLRTLQGVCYYRQLVKLERMSNVCDQDAGSYRGSIKTQFPENMGVETRLRFLSAHESLLSLWTQIRSSPPPFSTDDCPFHDKCQCTWQAIWDEALEVDQVFFYGSADLLGRLKSILFCARKMLADTMRMSTTCKLAALESLSILRDEIIEGMLTHFEGPS